MGNLAEIKSRPILFSAPMVRAILDGRKTQTRRVLKGSTEFKGPYNPAYLEAHRNYDGWAKICPYGKPGDRLWVRETWQLGTKLDKFNAAEIAKKCLDAGYVKPGAPTLYPADGAVTVWGDNDRDDFGDWGRKRSSRFMPRWASRITVEITEVWVQRLQEISEEDAKAEGTLPEATHGPFRFGRRDPYMSYQKGYRTLWNSINGTGSWDANPWVWALTFRRIL